MSDRSCSPTPGVERRVHRAARRRVGQRAHQPAVHHADRVVDRLVGRRTRTRRGRASTWIVPHARSRAAIGGGGSGAGHDGLHELQAGQAAARAAAPPGRTRCTSWTAPRPSPPARSARHRALPAASAAPAAAAVRRRAAAAAGRSAGPPRPAPAAAKNADDQDQAVPVGQSSGSAGDSRARIATRPATPSTVPTCRAMLSTPLPVPNRSGGSAALPAPSSDGMVRPTPAPPMQLRREQVGQVGRVGLHLASATAPATPALTRQPSTATRPGPPSRAASRGATSRANGSTISGPGPIASPARTAE